MFFRSYYKQRLSSVNDIKELKSADEIEEEDCNDTLSYYDQEALVEFFFFFLKEMYWFASLR